ncbi:MAG: 4-(cytidine 5'-diphospho)-2-C-methyl-D-erythritol kinase [Eubacteriales bacterium]|nr:4-(cytidine 5'-diphospho)-2-C-methyl-D-erythritol kinase [Eubacteriales bacterium]
MRYEQNMNMKAFAKINLSLDIIGVRDNGYHELRMLMQSVSLHDDVELIINDNGSVELTIVDERGEAAGEIPADSSNLMCRAAELMRERFGIKRGVSMKLYKRIPSEAGLAGGSADAAAVLKGMNELFELGLSAKQLMELGVKLGADIPYCIMGGTALAEGIGDVLTPIDNKCYLHALLVKPKEGMSTPKVYSAYDRLIAEGAKVVHPDTNGLIEALESGDCTLVYERVANVLELPVREDINIIDRIKKDLIIFGAGASAMTGSGSVVYGLFADREKMHEAKLKIEKTDYSHKLFNVLETDFI